MPAAPGLHGSRHRGQEPARRLVKKEPSRHCHHTPRHQRHIQGKPENRRDHSGTRQAGRPDESEQLGNENNRKTLAAQLQ